MSIADEFSGLDMKNIVGGPLEAAARAQAESSKATSEFIESIPFEQKASKFTYTKDGKKEEVDIPLLTIVPIPSLQVDEVDILFDMEVKQSTDKQPPEN